MGHLKDITKAAAILVTAFSTTMAKADDASSIVEPYPGTTFFPSDTCIKGALLNTFGAESTMYGVMEAGLIGTQNIIDGKSVSADVYFSVGDSLGSLNITITNGTAPMITDAGGNSVVEPAPNGTANLIYGADEGSSELYLEGYDQGSLKTYIDKLDAEIKSCHTTNSPTLAMS